MSYFFKFDASESSDNNDWKKTPRAILDSMHDWARENLSDIWGFDIATSSFWFIHEEDYILFVLRWM